MRRISVVWLLLLAGVWWVLAGPGAGGLAAGVLAVGLGVLVHAGLGGPGSGRLSLRGALGFAPFFLSQSFRGGVDVARRALSPSLPLAPAFAVYRTRLPAGRPRVFFVNCVSLLPGTFSAELDDRSVRVHLLATGEGALARLGRLEDRVAALFGLGHEGGDGAEGGHEARQPAASGEASS